MKLVPPKKTTLKSQAQKQGQFQLQLHTLSSLRVKVQWTSKIEGAKRILRKYKTINTKESYFVIFTQSKSQGRDAATLMAAAYC